MPSSASSKRPDLYQSVEDWNSYSKPKRVHHHRVTAPPAGLLQSGQHGVGLGVRRFDQPLALQRHAAALAVRRLRIEDAEAGLAHHRFDDLGQRALLRVGGRGSHGPADAAGGIDHGRHVVGGGSGGVRVRREGRGGRQVAGQGRQGTAAQQAGRRLGGVMPNRAAGEVSQPRP
ncbi:hypothetical protein, partial [Azospirillum sp. B506]|uniref:hypothetical protein n=1 Tax=Azospirillum sp. B506 TaxID=137721 RepID=UPI0005B286E1